MESGCQPSTSHPQRALVSDAPAQVLVLDDDRAVVDYLLDVLAHAGMTCEGFTRAGQLLRRLPALARDRVCVVVSDFQMPEQNGLELSKALRADGFFDPIILMSAFLDVKLAVEAMHEGFFHVIEKPIDVPVLLDQLTNALRGARRRRIDLAWYNERLAHLGRLTPRELEVLQQLSFGSMNKVVAAALGLSVKTVEMHRQHLMEKLELKHAPDLLRFAIEWRVNTPAHFDA